MSPRPYRLGKRQAASEETRRRIIAAVRDLIMTESGAFSIDAVAKQAGVARMTVYYQFGSRVGLLEALFDTLGGRHFRSRLPNVMSEPEPLDSLAGLIDAFSTFWSAERLVTRRIRGMAALDLDFEGSIRSRDERRRQILRAVLGRISQKHGKPAEGSFEDALDVLFALTSFATFDTLAGDARTPEDVALLVQRLARLALGIDGAASSDGH